MAMHVGIALVMGLYLFSSIMIILNLAAFGPGLIRRRQTGPEEIHGARAVPVLS